MPGTNSHTEPRNSRSATIRRAAFRSMRLDWPGERAIPSRFSCQKQRPHLKAYQHHQFAGFDALNLHTSIVHECISASGQMITEKPGIFTHLKSTATLCIGKIDQKSVFSSRPSGPVMRQLRNSPGRVVGNNQILPAAAYTRPMHWLSGLLL